MRRAVARRKRKNASGNVVSKIGEYSMDPHIDTFESALACYNLKSMRDRDLATYMQQLETCMTHALASVRERVTSTNLQRAFTSLTPLETLRAHLTDYMCETYKHRHHLTETGSAKGWSMASVCFCVIMLISRVMCAFEFVLRYAAAMHNLDMNQVPHVLHTVSLTNAQLRTIPSPKLFMFPSGLGDRLQLRYLHAVSPKLRYNPYNTPYALANSLVVYANLPFGRMTMLQHFVCWRHLCDRSLFLPPTLDRDFLCYLDALLSSTAELCMETWDVEEDALDLGDPYKTKTAFKGISADQLKNTVSMKMGQAGKITAEDQTEEDLKKNSSETAGPRFYGEVCAMFHTVYEFRRRFVTEVAPKIDDASLAQTCNMEIMRLCHCESGEMSKSVGKTDYFDALSSATRAWIRSEMDSVNDNAFVKRVIDRMRRDYVPDCTDVMSRFANNYIAPRDTGGLEEVWYGIYKSSFILNKAPKLPLHRFESPIFPPAVAVLPAVFVFALKIMEKDRSIAWETECFFNHTADQMNLRSAVNPLSYPKVMQIGSYCMVKLKSVLRADNIYDAITAWVVHTHGQCEDKLHMAGNVVRTPWMGEILSQIAEFCSHPTIARQFSDQGDEMVVEAHERFGREMGTGEGEIAHL